MGVETYIQTSLIPLLALIAILVNSNSRFASISNVKRFQRLTIFLIGVLLADTLTWYMFAHTNTFSMTMIWIANIFYFILASGTSYFWFLYVYHQIYGERQTPRQKNGLKICAIPFLMLCIVIILSPWTNALFYIDSTTHAYIRGSAHLLYSLCMISYIIGASTISFIAARKSLFRSQKADNYFLLFAGLLPVIGFCLQMVNPDLIFLWPFSTVGVCLLYINFQEQRISIDALTSLNNRKNLERYLQLKVGKGDSNWYFIMIDVDDFKTINDRFGHIEGDHALQLIAQGLKKSFGLSSAFLSRYGGDEFALIVDASTDLEIELLIQSVQDEVWNLTQVHETPYQILLSAGYAKFVDMQSTPPLTLVAIADEQMYANKNMRKHKHMKI